MTNIPTPVPPAPVDAATPPAAPPAPTASPFTVRRRSAGAFVPRPVPAESDGVVIARNVLSARQAGVERTTSRQRKIAGDLPAWEPLPPGELVVTRPGS